MTPTERATKSVSLFSAVGEKRFGPSTCFLCGSKLGGTNRTVEHVVPGWAQDRFKLWNQELVLLNGTTIPYRQLTIPCCSSCNNVHLAPLESTIARAIESGADEVRKLDKTTLFFWLGKVFFGLLYKQVLIPLDRRSPDEGPILPVELLDHYKMHHVFLQGVRLPLKFETGFPASIFVFSLQESDDISNRFDLNDGIAALTISIRLGRVGIIAALQDGGAQAEMFDDYMTRFEDKSLHPLQFAELTAKVFYKASLFNRTPKYMLMQGSQGSKEVTVVQMPLAGFSTKPVFDEWDFGRYAKCLSRITGYPVGQIYEPPNKVMTWLTNDRDEFVFIDLRQ